MRKARLQGALLPCRFGNILVDPGYRGLHGRSRYRYLHRDLAGLGRMPPLLMRALVIALALIAGIGAGAVYIATTPAWACVKC